MLRPRTPHTACTEPAGNKAELPEVARRTRASERLDSKIYNNFRSSGNAEA